MVDVFSPFSGPTVKLFTDTVSAILVISKVNTRKDLFKVTASCQKC